MWVGWSWAGGNIGKQGLQKNIKKFGRIMDMFIILNVVLTILQVYTMYVETYQIIFYVK